MAEFWRGEKFSTSGFQYVTLAQLAYDFADKSFFIDDDGNEIGKDDNGDDKDGAEVVVGRGELYGFGYVSKREVRKLQQCDFLAATAEELKDVQNRGDDWMDDSDDDLDVDDFDDIDELSEGRGWSYTGRLLSDEHYVVDVDYSALVKAEQAAAKAVAKARARAKRLAERAQLFGLIGDETEAYAAVEDLVRAERVKVEAEETLKAAEEADADAAHSYFNDDVEVVEGKRGYRVTTWSYCRPNTRRRWQRRPGRYLGDHNSGLPGGQTLKKVFVPVEVILSDDQSIRIH